jgi:hypothetical protein
MEALVAKVGKAPVLGETAVCAESEMLQQVGE